MKTEARRQSLSCYTSAGNVHVGGLKIFTAVCESLNDHIALRIDFNVTGEFWQENIAQW